FRAEDVRVAVVDLEGEGVDRRRIDAAAAGARPDVERVPGAAAAARGGGELVLHERRLHGLVPGAPLDAVRAVELEEREAGVVPVVVVDAAFLPGRLHLEQLIAAVPQA